MKKYLEFIKESGVEAPTRYNSISPYDDYFDEVQDCMKELLVQKGYTQEQADAMVTNDPSQSEEDNIDDPNGSPGLVIQFGKKIQKEVKDLYQKKTTPEDVAKYFIDAYLNKTVFNNQGEEKEPNAMIGDRATNNIDSSL